MKTLNFNPFPEIKTKRLTLRQLTEMDNLEVFLLRSDDIVNKYIDRPKQSSFDDAQKFISKINNGIKNNDWIYWVITLSNNPRLIGTICLWNFSKDITTAEVGYELNPSYQKQGIMNEMLSLVLEFGFDNIGLNRIDAYTHKDNLNSTNLLLKNNFKLDKNRVDKENVNNIVFSILNQNY